MLSEGRESLCRLCTKEMYSQRDILRSTSKVDKFPKVNSQVICLAGGVNHLEKPTGFESAI